jgi:hypothetical protein
MTPMKPMPMSRGFAHSKGNTMIEFALVISFAMPLLLYTFQLGITLSRSIQVRTVNRDAGSMFVRNIDFSLPGNQQILARLARGLGITTSGGNGVIILSQVMYVGDNECLAGGLGPDPGDCPNFNQYVFVRRLVIGNAALRSSDFGTPSAGLIASDGGIGSQSYLTDPGCVAAGFGSLLTLNAGELSYISETFETSAGFTLPGISSGTYTRNFF